VSDLGNIAGAPISACLAPAPAHLKAGVVIAARARACVELRRAEALARCLRRGRGRGGVAARGEGTHRSEFPGLARAQVFSQAL